jgi:hypothetical protein
LRGIDEFGPAEELGWVGSITLASFLVARVAGIIGVASYVPMRGREM